MLLKKKQAEMKADQKPLVLGKSVIEELRKMQLDGANILQIDQKLEGKLKDIRKIVTSFDKGAGEQQIVNIGLEFKDRIILVPTSKEFDHDVFDNDTWFKSVLRIRHTTKMNPDGSVADLPGEYTGPETVSFGMPGELNVVSNESIVEHENVETK